MHRQASTFLPKYERKQANLGLFRQGSEGDKGSAFLSYWDLSRDKLWWLLCIGDKVARSFGANICSQSFQIYDSNSCRMHNKISLVNNVNGIEKQINFEVKLYATSAFEKKMNSRYT